MKFLEPTGKHDTCVNTMTIQMHTRHILSTGGFVRREIKNCSDIQTGDFQKLNQNEIMNTVSHRKRLKAL